MFDNFNDTTQLKPIVAISLILSLTAIIYFYQNYSLLAYGDAESHLNIAKRITHSITPGLAQLGGIWLPLPHLLMVPLTNFDWLYRTGLAGAVISSIAFVFSCVYLYRTTFLITKHKVAAFFSFLVFALNPNILYLQSTAMTELLLIAFFMGSIYYFLSYLKNPLLTNLIISALFTMGGTLSRYDGWLLVIFQIGILAVFYLKKIKFADIFNTDRHTKDYWKKNIKKIFAQTEAYVLLFGSLASVGIVLWILWDLLILNDPLYFTNSPFSAKSQQQGWLGRGELPAYHNLKLAFVYYTVTVFTNLGTFISASSLLGLGVYLLSKMNYLRLSALVLFFVPFIFYIITLYAGQSIIFIPSLAPVEFEFNLFNVRYGVMMIPASAFLTAFLLFKLSLSLQKAKLPRFKHSLIPTPKYLLPAFIMVFLLAIQSTSFLSGKERVISLDDSLVGLSASKVVDAQFWLQKEYDGGMVLIDDYARMLSIIRTGLPMQNIIYVGTKPYWEESLQEPEKYASWIIMHKGDIVWRSIYDDQDKQGRLYAHFQKVYTSPIILIFKRNNAILKTQSASLN